MQRCSRRLSELWLLLPLLAVLRQHPSLDFYTTLVLALTVIMCVLTRCGEQASDPPDRAFCVSCPATHDLRYGRHLIVGRG